LKTKSYQVKVTFGTPLASQTSLAVSWRPLAAFEVKGDFTMMGLSAKKNLFLIFQLII
jgi:hypothetical protein